jgi:hypothetical protein
MTTMPGAAAAGRLLAAQIHALRQTAALLERAGAGGLALAFYQDEISIQVPEHLGPLPGRAAAVARLAAAAGTGPARTGGQFVASHGELAGHRACIFTPARQQDKQEDR